MKKSSKIYVWILCVWGVCALALLVACGFLARVVFSTYGVSLKSITAVFLLFLNGILLGYMWLGSVKDFIFSLVFLCMKKWIIKRYEPIINMQNPGAGMRRNIKNPKFLLLYCTCNDFNGDALLQSMKQDYDNFETLILDDSSKREYKKAIDDFSKKYGVEVIRRKDRKDFKAGNLNHCLQNRKDYDYFVVLDSDERIPSNYIQESLKYFAYSEDIGVVQASHKATKGSNVFQSLMGLSVQSNGRICQVMKNFYGSNALIGHGMAISRKCYEKTKGFPAVVAEDISFAIDVKNNGFQVVYAPNIVCEEEFPVNYLCLKKRQAKWVQGNVEFMKKYNKDIFQSKMSWYEKLDVVLSHYNLPIIPMLSMFLVLNTVFIGALGLEVGKYSLLLITLMLLFLISPLIPDFFVHGKRENPFKLLAYALLNFVVYASLVPMMIVTVLCALFGKKAKFIVTPKEEKRISLKEALKGSADSLLFALLVGITTYVTYFSVLPTVLLVSCCALAPVAILVANIKRGATL